MNDFDFLIGSWDVLNRRRTKMFAGSDEWDEFPGTSECRSVFEGAGNFDEIVFPTKGTRGATLRLWDVRRGVWALHWTSSRTGLLDSPVVGGFSDGIGVFMGMDEHEGRPVPVRFNWTRTETDTPRWSQEYSGDGGRTWEVNWVMDFSRR